MGLLALMGFYGMSPARENEKLANAQKELIGNLRSSQNKAIAGSGGGNTAYSITQGTYSFSGISISNFNVCFYNPNLATPPCAVIVPVTITLTNNSNGATKRIQIDGSANRVTNIYAL